MLSIIKRCPDCGQPIRVFSQDEIIDCESEHCGQTFRVMRDEEGNISLRHVYYTKRPDSELRLTDFMEGLLT
jgi:hypothetical protein